MTSREEDEARLRNLLYHARRCQHITRRFAAPGPNQDPLTEWDERHAKIDALLDKLACEAIPHG